MAALRACLRLTAQRESKEAVSTLIYQRAYEEAISGFAEGSSSSRERGAGLGRDDRIHGSLLIINELVMNSAWSDEVCVISSTGEVLPRCGLV